MVSEILTAWDDLYKISGKMMMKLISTILLLVLLPCVSASADEVEKSSIWSKENLHYGLAIEPALAAVAYMSSLQPRLFGVVSIFSPLAGLHSGGPSKPAEWTMVAGFEIFAAYNLSVDQNSTSRQEIFRNDFLTLNALLAATMAVSFLTEKSSQEKKASINYVPKTDGGALLLSLEY